MSNSPRNRVIEGTRGAFEKLEDVGYALLEMEDGEDGISEADIAYIGGHIKSSIAVLGEQLNTVKKIFGKRVAIPSVARDG